MTIQIISLIIALLAVIAGPIITYRITKKNLEFQFRTMTQGGWIDKLEETSVSFLSFTLEWIEKYRALEDKVRKNPVSGESVNSEIDRIMNGINSSIIKLQLLLDSEKTDQKIISDNIIEMKSLVNSKKFDDPTISRLKECHDNIISKLKMIFHQERKKISKIYS